LWEPFSRDRKIKGRGLEHLTRRWTKHLEPFFGQYCAAEVGTDLLNEYVDARLEKGAQNATINREIAVLRGMLRLGFFAKPQKVRTLPQFPRLNEDNIRKEFLDPEKYHTLAANASELWLRAIIEVAYTWGWRKSELRMRVRQVDFNANVVRLDPGMTKNKEGREVTMTPTIRALLAECAHEKKAQDFLFTRADDSPVHDFRRTWRNLCLASGVGEMMCRDCNEVVTGNKCNCGSKRPLRYRGLTVHDLRRTAVRNLVRAGIPEHTAMKISGHKTRSVFDRYDIVDQRDISNAMLKLEQARNEIVTKSVTNPQSVVTRTTARPN
jgi:integrase